MTGVLPRTGEPLPSDGPGSGSSGVSAELRSTGLEATPKAERRAWHRLSLGASESTALLRGLTAPHAAFQFSSVAQLCPTLCDPMNHSMPGLPVHHQLLESTQTHVHRVSDDIQPSHPWSSPSPPALNLSQHQGLFQRVSSSHQVAKVLEFQLQHQSFQ